MAVVVALNAIRHEKHGQGGGQTFDSHASHDQLVLQTQDDNGELDEDGEEPVPVTDQEKAQMKKEMKHQVSEAHRKELEALAHPERIPSALDEVIPVVSTSKKSDHTSSKGKYHIQRDGVQLGLYSSWIQEEISKEEACMELPFTLIMLVAFAFMCAYHLRQDTVAIVENAMAADIRENANFAWAHAFGHKGIEDVNSFADFWSWTRLGLLPLVTAPWGYSEDLGNAVRHIPGSPAYDTNALPSHRRFPGHRKAVPARNDYLRYNRIIGGVRFRQEVVWASEDKCTFPSDTIRRWFGKPCSPSDAGQLSPDLSEAGELESPARIEWSLTEHGDLSSVLAHMVDMEDGCASAIHQNRTCQCLWCADQIPAQPWLNEMTLRVEISFVIYNPNHGLYSYVGVNFWFNRAGHIYKLINIRSAWSSLFHRPLIDSCVMLMADIIWLLMVLYVMVGESKEVCSIVRSKQKAWYLTIFEDYMAFWNLVDWISIFFALMIILRFALLVVATANTNDLLGNHVIGLTSNADEPPGQVLPRVEAVYDAVAAMLESEESFRFQLCLYPTVLMLRLFKSFAAQPRLAVITSTFVKAGSDIFHFGIVFCAVYCCMTVNAVLFFGQDSQDFATFWRSFHSCFLVMFGDWDYEQMEQVGRIKASLWFWMFQIIVVLILQNIMLAILMEAYTRVKLGSAGSISLFDQINKQMRRWSQARKGQRVRLNDIWDALIARELGKGSTEEKMLKSSDKVFPQQLLPMVKNLMEAQAVRTLTDSQRDHDLLHQPSFSTEDMMDNLKTMRSKADNTLMCAAFTSNKVCEYDVAEEELLEDFKDKDSINESVDYNQFYSHNDTEQERGKRVAARRKHILEETQARFHRELETVRQHTQSRTSDLSHAVGGVLGEEIGALERRQKEQLKTTEQVQASLKSLKALAYKVNATVTDVCKISESAFKESADVMLPGSFDDQEGPDG